MPPTASNTPSGVDPTPKNRNRKSPRFSVANVAVASQTAVLSFLALKRHKKNAKIITIGSEFLLQGQVARFSGGGVRALLGL